MFRHIARVVIPVVVASVSVFANAQISPNLPNPTGAPNPLTTTLSIFRSNMQDKIMNAADMMPESKYSYRPTKEVRSFGEIVTHVADISYTLCSNAKGEANPATADRESLEDRDRSLPQRLVRLLRWRVLRVYRCSPQ